MFPFDKDHRHRQLSLLGQGGHRHQQTLLGQGGHRRHQLTLFGQGGLHNHLTRFIFQETVNVRDQDPILLVVVVQDLVQDHLCVDQDINQLTSTK